MTNRKCKIGKKAYAARRIAAIMMSATLAGTIAAGTPGVVQVSAATYSENADYIFEVLTHKLGYSEAAACGIMANIRCESTFNPHAWNAGGGSYGLCQWTGGRHGRLQSWCRSNGYDYTTIDGQLAYLEYELQSHYRGVEEYLRSVENTSDGAYKAGQYYCYHFEAPASRGSVSVYRGGLASGTFWEAYRPAEWYFEDGVWHYIKRDGTYHTSWLTIDNKTYYLDGNGNRISGWRTIDGDRYYFDADGVMASGWMKIDGKSYYFEEDGPLVTGLVMNGEDWYMLDESGRIHASQEMEHFAGNWNEKNRAEALAAADDHKSDDTLTADTETDSSTAAANEHGQQLLAAINPSKAEKDENSATALIGLGVSEIASAYSLPSLPSASDNAEAGQDQTVSSGAVSGPEEVSEEAAGDEAKEEAVAAAAITPLQEDQEDIAETAEEENAAEETAEEEQKDEAALSATVSSHEEDSEKAAEEEKKTEEAAGEEKASEAVTEAVTPLEMRKLQRPQKPPRRPLRPLSRHRLQAPAVPQIRLLKSLLLQIQRKKKKRQSLRDLRFQKIFSKSIPRRKIPTECLEGPLMSSALQRHCWQLRKQRKRKRSKKKLPMVSSCSMSPHP